MALIDSSKELKFSISCDGWCVMVETKFTIAHVFCQFQRTKILHFVWWIVRCGWEKIARLTVSLYQFFASLSPLSYGLSLRAPPPDPGALAPALHLLSGRLGACGRKVSPRPAGARRRSRR